MAVCTLLLRSPRCFYIELFLSRDAVHTKYFILRVADMYGDDSIFVLSI
jgi:hypothetical protein